MSKKNLLEESTIRGFMKLANLQPLTSKFLKETFEKVEEETNSDSVVCETDETLEEEMDGDELELAEEGKDKQVVPASKTEAPKGKGLAGKTTTGLDGAKSVKSQGKLKPLKVTALNSVKKTASAAVVSENLEDSEAELDAPAPEEDVETDTTLETPDHEAKVKDVINNILSQLQTLGGEYGIDIDVQSDQQNTQASPEDDSMEMDPEADSAEKLDEALNVITNRVTSRLFK